MGGSLPALAACVWTASVAHPTASPASPALRIGSGEEGRQLKKQRSLTCLLGLLHPMLNIRCTANIFFNQKCNHRPVVNTPSMGVDDYVWKTFPTKGCVGDRCCRRCRPGDSSQGDQTGCCMCLRMKFKSLYPWAQFFCNPIPMRRMDLLRGGQDNVSQS